jgi:hypothetical protein
MAGLKTPIFRDRAYLDWLRDQPCVITGLRPCDPAHIGTLGKSIKSPDNEVLPVYHDLHSKGHNSGEMSMWRKNLPNDSLRAALRAWARELHAKYEAEK